MLKSAYKRKVNIQVKNQVKHRNKSSKKYKK